MIVFPICLKLNSYDTYICIFEDQETITLTFYANSCSIYFGVTEDSISNQTYAMSMLERHEEITPDEFNKKIDEYNKLFNGFINSEGKSMQFIQKEKDNVKKKQEKKQEIQDNKSEEQLRIELLESPDLF